MLLGLFDALVFFQSVLGANLATPQVIGIAFLEGFHC